MNNITDFKPRCDLNAIAQLDAFISWAKDTLPKGIASKLVHPGIQWEMKSWHRSGVKSCTFTSYDSRKGPRPKEKIYMKESFMDFIKAVIVHHYIFRKKKSVSGILIGARALELSLHEITNSTDITKTSAAVLNRACELLKEKHQSGDGAYTLSKDLEKIYLLMVEKDLLKKSFRWKSPIRRKKSATLKDQLKNREKKLPSHKVISALGELFNNELSSRLDIITVSACALLLTQPSRIGELADVEHDCIIFKEDTNGNRRMFLRWYAEKGFGATTKPVVTGMEPVVERIINLLKPITDEARAYAAWLEDNPDEFPPHDGVPQKGPDDPLTYDEICSAIKLAVHPNHSARRTFKRAWLDLLAKRQGLSPEAQVIIDEIQQGWDTSKGKRIHTKSWYHYYQHNDKAVITLRKLNILLREKYLPKTFPYTTPAEDGKRRIKYRDALFTVRTGSLPDETRSYHIMPLDFGVEIACTSIRMHSQLGGSDQRRSIFQRHGYGDLKVNTHAFRHELNTEMHRAGLSQFLIDAFSGRTSRGSVYNHETVEERTQAIADVHPKTKPSNAAKSLDKIKTNAPLKLSDLTELSDDSKDFVIHKTHLGLCFHRFESEPCPKMGACLTCGKLACVKGDDVKLSNLKEERTYLKQRYEKAQTAEANGVFGAAEWCKKTGQDLYKCDALIKVLENPELEDGDIVWNRDNGWNLTRNAAAMAGLIDEKKLEAPKDETTPSLDEIAAILENIEV